MAVARVRRGPSLVGPIRQVGRPVPIPRCFISGCKRSCYRSGDSSCLICGPQSGIGAVAICGCVNLVFMLEAVSLEWFASLECAGSLREKAFPLPSSQVHQRTG
jgi:hypothetical protein